LQTANFSLTTIENETNSENQVYPKENRRGPDSLQQVCLNAVEIKYVQKQVSIGQAK